MVGAREIRIGDALGQGEGPVEENKQAPARERAVPRSEEEGAQAPEMGTILCWKELHPSRDSFSFGFRSILLQATARGQRLLDRPGLNFGGSSACAIQITDAIFCPGFDDRS